MSMFFGARFALFLSAAVVLAVMPGPGMLYVLGRTLNGGRREGIVSSIGTLLGGLLHVVAAAVGLSALLVTSATAFQVVRYAGAAYLIYLGVTMIRTRHLNLRSASLNVGARTPFVQGIVTEVLNPKTALFFLSFIPQFVSPQIGNPTFQFLLLGIISVSLNTAVDLIVAFFAASISKRLRGNEAFNAKQRTASGLGMIGLGLYVAVADNH